MASAEWEGEGGGDFIPLAFPLLPHPFLFPVIQATKYTIHQTTVLSMEEGTHISCQGKFVERMLKLLYLPLSLQTLSINSTKNKTSCLLNRKSGFIIFLVEM